MSSFRQLEQRYVSTEIALMEWNPTLDLIALATVTGEIFLHRLSWQKVWSFPSPGTKEEVVQVTALSWRPDGKILAYAYDNGKVILCDVENSESVHLLDVHCIVTSLNWVQTADCPTTEQASFYTDRSSEFLQKLYAYNKGYGTSSKQVEEVADDFKKMKGQKNLNILAIGMEQGIVHLHSFGTFPSGCLELGKDCKEHNKVLSVTLSSDFQVLTIILETKDLNGNVLFYYNSYRVPLLHENMEEMKIVALKYGQISSLLAYLASTIRAISEAWEDILLEVDTKIHNYAVEKGNLSEGSISDDFLELLMFGNPSDSLEKFLLHDLTESGLKKFGHSIELSYSNIQKLVLKRLQNVASSLFYHLNDLKGMALWTERFGALGLSEKAVSDAILCVGSFLLKAIEIQQVIDNSMKNFKAFFRWLYSVILRLSDEQIPPEISKLTQQDLQFVAEFLKENFTFDPDDSKKSTVKLERVAQYLKKEDLSYPVASSGNPWLKFLQDQPHWKETGLVFPYYPEKSLISQYSDLRATIDAAVKGPWSAMKDTVQSRVSHVLYKSISVSPPAISHFSSAENGDLYTVITDQSPPSKQFYLIRETPGKADVIEAVGIEFNELLCSVSGSPSTSRKAHHKILDVKFYNSEMISVLLMESIEAEVNFPIILQLGFKPLCSKMVNLQSGIPLVESNIPIVDAGYYVEKSYVKYLENMKASRLAVSGSRKVACVLFASRRQVRLFEMDVEEDEDEDFEGEDSIMKDSSQEGSMLEAEGESESVKCENT